MFWSWKNASPPIPPRTRVRKRSWRGSIYVVGVVEDEFYILLTDLGDAGYVPQSWLWEGNG